jgi:hypothetical protein
LFVSPLPTEHDTMLKEIIEVTLHEDISIQVDSAMLYQFLQADYIRAVRHVGERPAKYFSRRFYLDRGNQFAS